MFVTKINLITTITTHIECNMDAYISYNNKSFDGDTHNNVKWLGSVCNHFEGK